MTELQHQSQLRPEDNKFHKGNGQDGKFYWLTPWNAPEFVCWLMGFPAKTFRSPEKALAK
jgi:hypothetical protein